MKPEPKPIPTDLGLVLLPAENGGWIIQSVRDSHLVPSIFGAFTTPADMITALQEAFGLKPTIDETWLNVVAQSTKMAREATGIHKDMVAQARTMEDEATPRDILKNILKTEETRK